MSELKVTQIFIYPIKSTAAIALQESRVKSLGLAFDRRWMVVNPDGVFMTGRQYPAMTQIQTSITAEQLEINAHGMPVLGLPLSPDPAATQSVKVWRDECVAISAGKAANEWFSDYLNTSCQLVNMPEDFIRPTAREYSRPGDRVSFADGFPMLLISEASLHDLNQRLIKPVSMLHFRPNIVVSGCEAYEEDRWRDFKINDIAFEGVKGCTRCVFTTVDPATGAVDPTREPLKTLSGYRRREQGGVYFGQNIIPRGEGVISVGDIIHLN